MTMGMWTCKKCSHSFMWFIYGFIRECPECGQKYRQLATIWGYHVIHTIPWYIMEGEDYKEATMTQAFALARGRQTITFVCHDRDFYKWLKEHKPSDNIEVKMGEEYKNGFYEHFFNKQKDEEADEFADVYFKDGDDEL